MAKTFRFIEPNTPEWERMWHLLSEKNYLLWGKRDRVCRNEQFGESWQYMGTTDQPGKPSFHEFRHRMHPRSNRREYLHIPATQQPTPPETEPYLEIGGVLDCTGTVHSDADPGL